MSPAAPEAVVLLHGMWMNRFAMHYLARALSGQGFVVSALTYRSMRETFSQHLARVAQRIAACEARRIHLVGHSMGGVIALRYLQRMPDARIGRMVLLGAPVAGCRAAASLARGRAGLYLLGESLGLWREPFDLSLDPRVEVGAIAGTLALGLGRMVVQLPKPNDGVVCLDETKFPGLRDHLVLPVGHSLMLVSPRVARQTGAFLRTGAFQR